jgi:two-component system chemotaxis response regulator CheB
MQVVGAALDGRRAVELVAALRPHVVTLDLGMPGVSGLDVLDRIMRQCPTPVVVVSGVSRRAAAITRAALEKGAVEFILKYVPGVNIDPGALRQDIVNTVRAAARLKVIRPLRAAGPTPARAAASTPGQGTGKRPTRTGPDRGAVPLAGRVTVIGASTGGPGAIRDLLVNLPADFVEGILVVQHLPAFFTGVLATQLDRQVSLAVREARDGDALWPGVALVAPGDWHLLVTPEGRVALAKSPPCNGHRPSIDVTMQAAAQVYGRRVKGVLLTGMGEDGVRGLRAIREAGGTAFGQSGATCVVNGMPQRAIDQGLVDHVASPEGIARLLAAQVSEART